MKEKRRVRTRQGERWGVEGVSPSSPPHLLQSPIEIHGHCTPTEEWYSFRIQCHIHLATVAKNSSGEAHLLLWDVASKDMESLAALISHLLDYISPNVTSTKKTNPAASIFTRIK